MWPCGHVVMWSSSWSWSWSWSCHAVLDFSVSLRVVLLLKTTYIHVLTALTNTTL